MAAMPRCPSTFRSRAGGRSAQRVWIESGRDNLSVVAAGCAFYALFAVFPALSALIALYGLTADPATVEQQFDMLSSVLPPQAYDIVIEQIRPPRRELQQSLGLGFVLSLGLALWSVSNLTQAMFAALNIAYEEPERRSLLRFYLSAFAFAVLGILSGALMLLAIVYVPILFAYAGYSHAFELIGEGGALAAAGADRADACSRCSTATAPAAGTPNGAG